ADTLRSGVAATAAEIERLSEALAEAQDRTATAGAELAGGTADLGAIDDGDPELVQSCEAAVDALASARKRVGELVALERAAEQQRAHWRARVDALSVGLARRDGSGALLGGDECDRDGRGGDGRGGDGRGGDGRGRDGRGRADSGGDGRGRDGLIGTRLDGVLGVVPELITVEPWARAALAAALGELAGAVAVDSPDTAVDALQLLRSGDAGRAALLVGGAPEPPPPGPPPAGRWAAELVNATGPVAGSLRRALRGVVVVDDLAAARAVTGANPELTAVTVDGDVLAADRAHGGCGVASSALDVQAAVNEAAQAGDDVERELSRITPALDGARAEEAARLREVEVARQVQVAGERRRAAASARLGCLEQAVRSATAEAQRLRVRRDEVESRRSDALLALEAAEHQLAVASDEPVDDEPDTEVRDAAADALAAARNEEVEARLALRTAEERARAIAGRADSLRTQASSERQARTRAAAAR
ncbi:MAG: chromosome segregation protein SMC, partial [Pseudonocardia sp.]